MTTTNEKPWGSDEDFDAEKAWKLIVDLRADKTGLQTKLGEVTSERDQLKTERQAREDEGKSAEQKAADELAKISGDLTKAQKALFIERALRKHEIPEDLVDFLTGDTEEEILAKAERLSKVKSTPTEGADEEKDGKPGEQIPGKPKPDLTPGHGGDQTPAFDVDATVAAIRGNS